MNAEMRIAMIERRLLAVEQKLGMAVSGPPVRRRHRTPGERCSILLKVREYMADGKNPHVAAALLGINFLTYCRWSRRYDEQGIGGLRDKPHSGRPRKHDTD